MAEDTELHRSLGRIEGKVDGIFAVFKDHGARMDKQDTRIDETDERVEKIEKRLIFYTGVATCAAFLLGKIDFASFLSIAAEAMTK